MNYSQIRSLKTGVPNKPAWTFAVIADSHVNPCDDNSSSPWEVNRLANARMRAVVEELNEHRPEFVIHLGDMIHPVPAQSTYAAAVRNFSILVEKLEAPLHLVPGNHDVGDKPLEWTPAEIVTEDHISLYEQYFGRSYYSFYHRGCHFVVVNAQLINTGFPGERQQESWLKEDLRRNRSARTFVCLHYPPYILDPTEPGHYDNLDEPGRSWLLSLIEENSVEAIFAGHVHNFFYNRYGDTDFYALPSTSFVRSDYSEFGRVPPEDADGGRNDIGKLGYFLVEIYPETHVPLIQRTYGGTQVEKSAPIQNRIGPNGPSRRLAAPIGLDLRHSWSEIVEVPYTGGVDEFARKRARNDYPLLGLWELGIRTLRLPLADLQSLDTGERVRDLGKQGHRFVPFCFGAPTSHQVSVINTYTELIEAVEVIISSPEERHEAALTDVARELDAPLLLSKLRGHDEVVIGGEGYAHVLNHGYELSELQALKVSRLPGDGLSVRIARDQSPLTSFATLTGIMDTRAMRVMAHVRLAGEIPARPEMDQLAAANRVAETILAAFLYPEINVVLDTLIEQDRGYFMRAGLLDRRYNLTLAGHTARNLTSALAQAGPLRLVESSGSPDTVWFHSDAGINALVLPTAPTTVDRLAHPEGTQVSPLPHGRVAQLGSGTWSQFAASGPANDIWQPLLLDAPVLFTFDPTGRDNASEISADSRPAAPVPEGR